MRLRILALMALLAALPLSLDAQRRLRFVAAVGGGGGDPGDVLLREDCGSGGSAWPECGATAVLNEVGQGTDWDWTQRNAAGPQGQTCTEWEWPYPTGSGEAYFGRNWVDAIPTINQGDSVVVRWFFKTISPEDTGTFAIKHWILGDQDPNPDENRIIATWRQWETCDASADHCYAMDVDRNINGTNAFFLDPSPADTWHSIQVEIDTSSTSVATDGRIKLWLDTDVYASPTHSNIPGAIALPSTYAGSFGFGVFGETNEAGTNTIYQTCMVEVQTAASGVDAFDANWTNGGSFWARSVQTMDGWLAMVTGRPAPKRGWSNADRKHLFGTVPVERAN